MVISGGRTPDQLPRAIGSSSSCAVICEGQMQDIHSVENLQHHSSGLHKSSGGYSLQRVGQLDKGSVDVVPREEHTHHSSTPPRSSEFHHRCGIMVADRQDRLEAEFLYFSQHSEDFWPLEVDLFATRLSAQCQRYFSWWPDLSAEATDAFLQVWTHIKGYANPPWNLVGRTLTQVQTQ